jgi:hypothetical protein
VVLGELFPVLLSIEGEAPIDERCCSTGGELFPVLLSIEGEAPIDERCCSTGGDGSVAGSRPGCGEAEAA